MNKFVTLLYRATLASVAVGSVLAAPTAHAQGTLPGRDVPARTLPVPTTVSPHMQKIIATPINPNWKDIPKTPEAWKAQVAQTAAPVTTTAPTS